MYFLTFVDCLSQHPNEVYREQKHSTAWPWFSDVPAGLVWFWLSALVSALQMCFY